MRSIIHRPSIEFTPMTLLTDQPAWQQLEALYANLSRHPLKRTPEHMISIDGLSLDYSRNHFNHDSLFLFSQLAEQSNLSDAIHRLMSGDIVNISEQRAAWHTLLRDPHPSQDVKNCYEKIRQCELDMLKKNITDIVHIGIGGSYLGPRFLYDAFSTLKTPRFRCHFIANQNETSIQECLQSLNPTTTLIIIVSKSFNTQETMMNANYVLDWMKSSLLNHWPQQVLAVTSNRESAIHLGLFPAHIFPLWNWVGGRFSLWSAVSLCIVLSFGWEMFSALLSGAHVMDQHFKSQAWTSNIPVMLAFVGLLYRHFFSAQTQAIIPYHNAFTRLPAHLQQLHMESLGKQISQSGKSLNYPTGAIIWGGTGPGSQHSFHQLLLQGADIVPVDFITVEEDIFATKNCLAQAAVLLQGNREEEMSRHQFLPGNRPSTMISMPRLTPENIGALLAMYEHKVFVQAVLWDINPFDQWGVEAGKQLMAESSSL